MHLVLHNHLHYSFTSMVHRILVATGLLASERHGLAQQGIHATLLLLRIVVAEELLKCVHTAELVVHDTYAAAWPTS